MKFRYSTALFLGAVLLSGCDDLNKIDYGSADGAGTLEVVYKVDGAEVKSLAYGPSSRQVVVDVEVNNQDLNWNLVSDQDWLTVVEEEHKGNGSVTLMISYNSTLDSRADANLSFVAGQFEGYALTVSQEGNIFLIDKTYSAVSADAGRIDLTVTTLEDMEWETEQTEWLSVTRGGQTVEDGFAKTTLSLSWDANPGDGRFASLKVSEKDAEEKIFGFGLFQFGSSLSMDENGKILLDPENPAAVSVSLPGQLVSEVYCPEWASYTLEESIDQAVYTFTFTPNHSDCQEVRNESLSFWLKDVDEPIVFPSMIQDYIPAHGLVSGKGFNCLAKVWNDGGDISDWQNEEGVIEMMNHIDFDGVEDFVQIGTADKPFTGTIDGNYNNIFNLKSSKALFGYCQDAVIKNITIAESSSFSIEEEFSVTSIALASFAESLSGCTVSGCINKADVTFGGYSNLSANTFVRVAGLFAEASDGTVIANCENSGKVMLTEDASAKYTSNKSLGSVALGGIVAVNKASSVMASVNSGEVSNAAGISVGYVGGVAGTSDGVIESCVNSGNIVQSVLRESASKSYQYQYVAGIVGMSAGKLANNVNEGAVRSSSDVYYLRLGGIAGCLGTEYDKFDLSYGTYEVSANTLAASASVSSTGGARYPAVGGLYGRINKTIGLDLGTSQALGSVSLANPEHSTYALYYLGGYVGFLNQEMTVTNAVASNAVRFSQTSDETSGGTTILAVGKVVGFANAAVTMTNCSSVSGELTVDLTGVVYARNKNLNSLSSVGIGGILGYAAKDAELTSCTNSAPVNVLHDGKSNGFPFAVGGILGKGCRGANGYKSEGGKNVPSSIMDGNIVIRDCHNKAEISNSFYTNTKWYGGSSYTGGIVGQFRIEGDGCEGSMTVENCTNDASVNSFRGAAGGIVGYGYGMTVKDCIQTGTMVTGVRPVVGGIVGTAVESTVTGCQAVCNVRGTTSGGGVERAGGIVGTMYSNSIVSSCSYSGDVVKYGNDTTYGLEHVGAVVGLAGTETTSGDISVAVPDETCSITGCQVSGSVAGTVLTADAFEGLLCGMGSSSMLSGNAYWNK